MVSSTRQYLLSSESLKMTLKTMGISTRGSYIAVLFTAIVLVPLPKVVQRSSQCLGGIHLSAHRPLLATDVGARVRTCPRSSGNE
jgi:hypothetical protein